MSRFPVLVFFGLFGLVHAAEPTLKPPADVAREQGGPGYVKIERIPCTHPEIAQRILPQALPTWQKGEAYIFGRHYPLCWKEMGPKIWLLYEDGDVGGVETRFFQPEWPI